MGREIKRMGGKKEENEIVQRKEMRNGKGER